MEDYIYEMEIKNDEKLIIFGDFHGSYHTFYRLMKRLEYRSIIRFNDYKEPVLVPKYKMLFLGDIVDRGMNSFEILLFIFLMIKNSQNDYETNPQIIINRGNHEEKDTNTSEGLFHEINQKFGSSDTFDKINNFFNKCPSGVIVNYENASGLKNKIFCCHGCIPILKNMVPNIPEGPIVGGIEQFNLDYNVQLRWSDINVKIDQKFIDKGIRSKRGAGCILGMGYVNNILKQKNFSLIIRGHQDSNANTVIAGYDSKMKEGLNKHWFRKKVYDNGYDIKECRINSIELKSSIINKLIELNAELNIENKKGETAVSLGIPLITSQIESIERYFESNRDNDRKQYITKKKEKLVLIKRKLERK